ncbi:MAG TPA: copper chaperone PCu(A)C [Burkholderiales bacterium]|nr:copper chaperone PCu(A)C [Burkholderiales bacterium]
MIRFAPNFLAWVAFVFAGSVHAAELVKVVDPWSRATVPGQSVGGVYMDLVASEPLRLVAIRTAAAETAEVHQMKMEKGMMRMRAVPFLALPAGKTVKLRPGGYHVMLFDLKNSLVEGQKLKLELVVEDAAKIQHRIPVEALIRDRDAGMASGHDMH